MGSCLTRCLTLTKRICPTLPTLTYRLLSNHGRVGIPIPRMVRPRWRRGCLVTWFRFSCHHSVPDRCGPVYRRAASSGPAQAEMLTACMIAGSPSQAVPATARPGSPHGPHLHSSCRPRDGHHSLHWSYCIDVSSVCVHENPPAGRSLTSTQQYMIYLLPQSTYTPTYLQ